MKRLGRAKTEERGYSLLLTLGFVATSLTLVAGLSGWTASSTKITARHNAYDRTLAAAEAGTEVVIAQMDKDFLHQALSTNVASYKTILPSTFVTDSWASQYRFGDGHGHLDQSDVVCSSWKLWTNLASEFTGLYGLANTFQVTSYAKPVAGPSELSVGVSQNIQLTTIPVFQFAIYYSMDLEINPGAPMKVTGKTHANANLYVAPPSTLEFGDAVGVVGHIYTNRHPSDPTGGSKTTPIFDGPRLEQVSSLTLPIGTSNSPTSVMQILNVPPPGEDYQSQLGEQRYYNKADLIVITTNNTVLVKYNSNEDGSSFTTVATNTLAGTNSTGYTFIRTNINFYDYREGKAVVGTEIDVGALTNWLATSGASLNSSAISQLGHPINSIYVTDTRGLANKLTAVRITNGRYLPSGGLTVATPLPLYLKGNYNAPDLNVGSTNTSQSKPASLVSDAITVLSSAWDDTWNSSTALSSRTAVNTTVNAAFLSGIVQSTTVSGQGHYSGGVENFPRFLESWSSRTLTYNGSMVVMFPSRYATNFWISPGTYYNAPTRSWAFDINFLDPNKLPPCTPQVRKLQRGQWSVVSANTH